MQDIFAIVFDFDETLSPDSTSGFLDSLGIDVKEFWGKRAKKLLDDGWDPVPAYLYLMVEESENGNPITGEALAKWGKKLSLYEGATRIFNRLRSHVRTIDADVEVEFYVISSGIGEVLRHTRIAKEMKEIWASDFHYGKKGEILFPKRVISFTDKTRYIFHIAKGLIGQQFQTKPFEVNKKLPTERLRIPLSQMIFVGDGYTDIPCFSLVRNSGGIAIGVYDRHSRERWGKAWGFVEDGRVSNLVPADYRKNSALDNSLLMAAESMTSKIALRRKSYQG